MFINKMSRLVPVHHNLHFLNFNRTTNRQQLTRNYCCYLKNIKIINIQKNCFNFNEHFKFVRKSHTFTKSKNRGHTFNLFSLWAKQCEFVIAQRIRRSQQMFTLYSKLWEERAFKEMLKRIRQQLFRQSKNLVLGITGVGVYNWDSQKISNDEIFKQFNELEKIRELLNDQIICPACKNRIEIDMKLPNVKYCNCPNQPHTVKEKYWKYPIDKNNWEPFIERSDIIVWRKEYEDTRKYSYKMYGIYDDVNALDYLEVQINLPYRKIWDDSAEELKVIETHQPSHSDIIYWEMKWPRFFTNRDYVFKRRYYIDEEKQLIVMICQSTDHPCCPVKPTAVRVKQYWSVLVIRPLTSLHEPGIEFSLTYFDDPGVILPESMATWIAATAMPDFMKKMRLATTKYGEYLHRKGAVRKPCICKTTSRPETEETADVVSPDADVYEVVEDASDIILEKPIPKSDDVDEVASEDDNDEYEQIDPVYVDFTSNCNSTVRDNNTYWRYLRPSYLFS